MPTITTELLSAAIPDAHPHSAARFSGPLDLAAQRFGIDTPERAAHWFAQLAHESAALSAVVENLNYSAAALRATWPKRFDVSAADEYARNPERIANRAYAGRNGNGPEDSGDGWRFHGRGLVQITGRLNYGKCGIALHLPLLDQPELLEQPEYAALSAGWFWASAGLNALADVGNVEAITRRINGGVNGLADRQNRTTQALTAFVRAKLEV